MTVYFNCVAFIPVIFTSAELTVLFSGIGTVRTKRWY
jgi:hypothetical protein